MKRLRQEIYFPIIVFIHFLFWGIDLYFYSGPFMEVSSDTLLFGELSNTSWQNVHRILGEVFSSWVVTVFAFNFLMATRARWVESVFGGLDKMYLIHRRSGVIAVVLLLAHFIVVPRDLVAFNVGKPLGFYAFVLILLGVALSALPIFKRKISYDKWKRIHKLMGLFYVMGVVHGLMVHSLIKELPITRVYVFSMAAVGISAWFYKAFLFGFFNKPVGYSVQAVRALATGVTELALEPKQEKLVFAPGQFGFFSFPNSASPEQHPFTISSHPAEPNLRVSIKGLGDFTNALPKQLAVGDPVAVEGPYGRFSTDLVSAGNEVWIAGGIGITPFLSMAKAPKPTGSRHLYWCVSAAAEAYYHDELTQLAVADSGFSYTLWKTDERGYLSAKDLALEEDAATYHFLLCGPTPLKEKLTAELRSTGVPASRIHEEEFAFR